ncbi:hypothetical protein ACHWQZ_G008561 [Mnemiopsis leidyi]
MIALLFGIIAVANSLPAIHQFRSWKLAHGKVYEPKEELKRLEIFMDNLKYIEDFNARKDRTMTLGLNRFADLTNEEFRKYMTGSFEATASMKDWLKKQGTPYTAPDNFTASYSVDWRSQGAVTPVKDQGQCGSCYSFSTTGSIEGQWFLKKGSLVSLSEQQIVDCSTDYGNQGCDGGLMTWSFMYIMYAGGIDTEEAYPYEAEQNWGCSYDINNVGAKVQNYQNVGQSESDLEYAVATVGPISVAIDASSSSFQFYQSGVYYDDYCSSEYLDHAVLAVGYGSGSDGDYWIVKNSWGEGWGDDGYIMMARNNYNMCGIATMASFPIVE